VESDLSVAFKALEIIGKIDIMSEAKGKVNVEVKIKDTVKTTESALVSTSPSVLSFKKFDMFDLFPKGHEDKFTSKVAVLVDYENINKLTRLHNLWEFDGKYIPILKFVSFCNQNAESLTTTHIIECTGKDAVDHFISTFIGYHLALGNLHTVIILSRDNFASHQLSFHKNSKINAIHCNSERACIDMLQDQQCLATQTTTEFHY
jgi:hypothetical protein